MVIKRKPIIYLAGSCKSTISKDIKKSICSHDFGKPVEFLDPANFKPNRQNYNEIEEINDEAMLVSDLMVSIMVNESKAGSGIEMYVYKRVFRKPIILITNFVEDDITPRVRGLVDKISSIFLTTDKIQEWIDNWYNE